LIFNFNSNIYFIFYIQFIDADITQRVQDILDQSIPKGNLDIIKEKAVVKIQQLTPRLLEKKSKFNKPEEGSKESIKRLKKAVNIPLSSMLIQYLPVTIFPR
jgi:hypothetical protein